MTKLTDDQIKSNVVSLTRDLMLVPTTESRPDEIIRGFQLIRNHLENLEDIEIKDYEDKGIPSIVAYPKGIMTPDILMCAHIDVVDYPDTSVFNSKIEDGRIVGPGAGDMKGELAICLEIFRYFHTNYPGISLGIAITSDEEVGGASGIGFLVEKENLRCGTALVPDGGSFNRVTTHEKGILHLKVRCKGHYSHASRPWEGDNALRKLMRHLHTIDEYFKQFRAEDHTWYATCSTTMIHTNNEVVNRIPDDAEATLDIRFPQPHTSNEILERIKDITDDSLEVEKLISAEPTDLQPDPLYFKIAEKITGTKIDEVRDHGGSDARFLSDQGIPVVISRPIVGNLHSEEEWIDIESMVTFYKIYREYIEQKLKIGQS